jgi:hypothetical protein
MPAPPVCLDECTELDLIPLLAARGYDVVSIITVGYRAMPDPLVLKRATDLGRVLVTHNVHGFRLIDEVYRLEGRSHAGIIGVPQLRGAPFTRLELRVAMMLEWVGTQPHAGRLFQWGDLQRLLDRGFGFDGFSEDDVRLVLGRV